MEPEIPKTRSERAQSVARLGLLIKSVFEAGVEQVAKLGPAAASVGLAGFALVGSAIAFSEAQSAAAQLEAAQRANANLSAELADLEAEIPDQIGAEVSTLSEEIAGIDVTGIDSSIEESRNAAGLAQVNANGAQRTADDALGSAQEANRTGTSALVRATSNSELIGENTTAIDSALAVALAAQDSADTSQASADDAQTSADAADQSAVDAAEAAAEARALVDAIPAEITDLAEGLNVLNERIDQSVQDAADARAELFGSGTGFVDIGDVRIQWFSVSPPIGVADGVETLPAPFASAEYFIVGHRNAQARIALEVNPNTASTYRWIGRADVSDLAPYLMIAIGVKP